MGLQETVSHLIHSFRAGAGAFRREWSQASPLDATLDYSLYAARRQRYELSWAYFKNNAYSDLHSWAASYRGAFALYQYVRNIYNPARRLALFWQGALQGGVLDRQAGDGTRVKSALPIVTDNERLRPALARLWRDSNMQSLKDDYTLLGTIFGDTGWRVHDDPVRGKVTLQPLQPGELYDVVRDASGNVKGYTLVQPRLDPSSTMRRVAVYSETASRDGDLVVYRTFKDGRPYAWDGETDAWEIPYGFVPLVVVKHSGVTEWGSGEYEDDLSKIREVDDLASMVHDYVRKAVNAPMLLAGVDAPASGGTPTTRREGQSEAGAATDRLRQQSRQEIPLFYGPVGAEPKPILAPLDVAAAGARVDKLLEEFERDHPELRIDQLRVSGGLTGRALELAREPAEIKGVMLRTNYDTGTVAAQGMAVAIGGWRGYPGYEGFDLGSYARGDLEHSIGPRPIFEDSPSDQLERKEKFWKIVVDTSPTVDRAIVLRDLGWSSEKIESEFGDAAETGTEPAVVDEVAQALKEFRAAMSGASNLANMPGETSGEAES